jgi:hypothetical protein
MNTSGRIVLATVLGLALTSVALGFGHARSHGPGAGHAQGGAGRILERVVHPCSAGCLDANRTCVETATSTATSCVTSSCASDVAAAQTACKSGRTSACQTAMGPLRTCAQPCTDTAATSDSACRTTMTSCLATCGRS